MSDLDLGQQARVLWLDIGPAGPGDRKAEEFPSLMKAVTFVMEELQEAERATAVIAIEQEPGKLPLDRIMEIHATLTHG
ncbi:MAG: hypothetical protein JWN07_3135 [Hyphomicrobiales bacterium]|nr:hypothetical protein [Hyphomicrobiales bacterium]